VLTSGGDQIFPKGLPVGTVTKVGNGRDLFLNIKIKPAADLSKLEEVLVLVEKQERETPTEDAVRMRASDILAQRLPSVPDKPAADAASGHGASAASAGQPKTAVKQPAATGTKPQGLAGAAKPVASVKPAVTGASTAGVPKPTKTSAGASGTSITLVPDAQMSTDATGVAPTRSQPDASQTIPPSAQPKPVTPAPDNPQPPADENKPQ
jgi:rod shape-determining protein MreC